MERQRKAYRKSDVWSEIKGEQIPGRGKSLSEDLCGHLREARGAEVE